ncbi:hypothetical protein [Janibacter limosus]|uniref:hypothetical protein n=1 Tax=Janibacter limosus TaxID=53458 RepID=UPI0008331116|nr:hypothetical protein [Janibacter limosus]
MTTSEHRPATTLERPVGADEPAPGVRRPTAPASGTDLSMLTVRELIAQLARSEDQLNLARLQGEQQAGSMRQLRDRQAAIIQELRSRRA